MNKSNSSLAHWFLAVVGLYFFSCSLAAVYFNWQYAAKHGFASWLLFGEIVATAKSIVWPYFAFAPPTGDRASPTNSAQYQLPTGEPLSDQELERLRPILDHVTSGNLSNGDIHDARAILEDYKNRTGRRLGKAEYDAQFGPLRIILEYKYELGQSALLSWEKGQVVTTPTFNRLRTEVSNLVPATQVNEDDAMIRTAARRSLAIDTPDGRRFEFSRANIVAGLEKKKNQLDALRKLENSVADLLG
jgi:hypothetical protein